MDLKVDGPLAEGAAGPDGGRLQILGRSQEEINEPLVDVTSPQAAANTFKQKSYSIAENTFKARI